MRSMLCLAFALLAGSAPAQIAMPNFVNSFQSNLVRGYFFTAPTALIVTHLQVPDEAKYGMQTVALYKLSAPPPTISQAVPVTPLFFAENVPSDQVIPVIPPVIYAQGEVVAVLGAAGTTTTNMSNSYAPGNTPSSVLGFPITLLRCGIQANLATIKGIGPLWNEGNFQIARVRMWVAGHASAMKYGKGTPSGTTPAGELTYSDPFPPMINRKAEMLLLPGTAANTNAVLAIGLLQSNIVTPIGTLLNAPFVLTQSIPGPIPVAGTPISYMIPNTPALNGAKITFQAGVGLSGGGMTLTDGMAWTIGL